MREEILELLYRELAHITERDVSALSETTDVKEDLKLSSMELLTIIAALESEYDVYIKYTDLLHAQNVGEMADIIIQTIEG